MSTSAFKLPGSLQDPQKLAEEGANLVDRRVKPPTLGRTQLPYLDIAETIRNLGASQEAVKSSWYVRVLWVVSLILSIIYFVSAIALLITDLAGPNQEIKTYWAPLRYNEISKKWSISLEHVVSLRIGMLFFAMTTAMAIFRLLHVFGPLRTWYSNMVYVWSVTPGKGYAYNSFRWIGHGVLIGGIVAGAALISGALDIVVFSAVWGMYFCWCTFMLLMEMYNPVKSVRDGKYPHGQTEPAGERLPPTNWYMFLFSMVPFLFTLAVFTAYFAVSVDDKMSKVAWYVWAVPILLLLCTIAEQVVNFLYHALTFIRLYVWIEYVHLIVEFVLVISIPWFAMIGFLTD